MGGHALRTVLLIEGLNCSFLCFLNVDREKRKRTNSMNSKIVLED